MGRPPHREEAGTPNLLGAVAFAAAASTLEHIGWDRIVGARGRARSVRTSRELLRVPGLRIYGPGDASATPTIGVVPFRIEGLHHGLVAAVLGYEHGVGVRSGCFCAHPYVAHLLGMSSADSARRTFDQARSGDKRDAPGLVRISLGCYNDVGDLERAIVALERVATGNIRGAYCYDEHGVHVPCDVPRLGR